ncbi:MAG: AfsR/SARP family transcriptional regulator, partial [Myxococcota bacterium]
MGGTKTNVFEPVTDLVGRDDDLDRLDERFANGARLVTLRGTIGVGKSRLGAGYASSLSPSRWPGGIWRCDLAAATSRDGIAVAIAGVLPSDLTEADVSFEGLLATFRKLGAAFLLLDNAE